MPGRGAVLGCPRLPLAILLLCGGLGGLCVGASQAMYTASEVSAFQAV